ncbi:MAG: hypothetical protein AABX59_00080 [Nanoarchaeota archaeon]
MSGKGRGLKALVLTSIVIPLAYLGTTFFNTFSNQQANPSKSTTRQIQSATTEDNLRERELTDAEGVKEIEDILKSQGLLYENGKEFEGRKVDIYLKAPNGDKIYIDYGGSEEVSDPTYMKWILKGEVRMNERSVEVREGDETRYEYPLLFFYIPTGNKKNIRVYFTDKNLPYIRESFGIERKTN